MYNLLEALPSMPKQSGKFVWRICFCIILLFRFILHLGFGCKHFSFSFGFERLVTVHSSDILPKPEKQMSHFQQFRYSHRERVHWEHETSLDWSRDCISLKTNKLNIYKSVSQKKSSKLQKILNSNSLSGHSDCIHYLHTKRLCLVKSSILQFTNGPCKQNFWDQLHRKFAIAYK